MLQLEELQEQFQVWRWGLRGEERVLASLVQAASLPAWG